MNAKELKQFLTEDQIIIIVESLGSYMTNRTQKDIIFTTFCCHGGNSHKLYYSIEYKSFLCYTNCGQIGSVFDLVMSNKGYTLHEAYMYVCNLLGISTLKEGFSPDIATDDIIDDWSFINSYKRKKTTKTTIKSNFYDEKILNIFQDIYTSEWRNDGISNEVMKTFEIKYCTLKQSIIIPHRDINGGLVGVRQRNLLDESIDTFGKYCPFYIHGITYKHPLGEHFYGLHINKKCIQRVKKVMLVESEKGVLQAGTLFGINNNFTLGLSGNKVSSHQRDLLMSLGVEEVIIALDRQYVNVGDVEYYKWVEHLQKHVIQPLVTYFKVYVIWDMENLLDYKDSPLDKGRETLLKLMKQKIYVST